MLTRVILTMNMQTTFAQHFIIVSNISSYSCIVGSGTCDGGPPLLLPLAAAHLPHPRLLLPPGAGHGPAEVGGGRQCRILTWNHPGQKHPHLNTNQKAVKNQVCLPGNLLATRTFHVASSEASSWNKLHTCTPGYP